MWAGSSEVYSRENHQGGHGLEHLQGKKSKGKLGVVKKIGEMNVERWAKRVLEKGKRESSLK